MSKRDEIRKQIDELRRVGLIITADGEQVREHPERVRSTRRFRPNDSPKQQMMERIRSGLQHRGQIVS